MDEKEREKRLVAVFKFLTEKIKAQTPIMKEEKLSTMEYTYGDSTNQVHSQ